VDRDSDAASGLALVARVRERSLQALGAVHEVRVHLADVLHPQLAVSGSQVPYGDGRQVAPPPPPVLPSTPTRHAASIAHMFERGRMRAAHVTIAEGARPATCCVQSWVEAVVAWRDAHARADARLPLSGAGAHSWGWS